MWLFRLKGEARMNWFNQDKSIMRRGGGGGTANRCERKQGWRGTGTTTPFLTLSWMGSRRSGWRWVYDGSCNGDGWDAHAQWNPHWSFVVGRGGAPVHLGANRASCPPLLIASPSATASRGGSRLGAATTAGRRTPAAPGGLTANKPTAPRRRLQGRIRRPRKVATHRRGVVRGVRAELGLKVGHLALQWGQHLRRNVCRGVRKGIRPAWSWTVLASSAALRIGMAASNAAGGKTSGWTKSAWRRGSRKVCGFKAPNICSHIHTLAWTALVSEWAHTSSKWSNVSHTDPWMPWRRSGKGRDRTLSCFTVKTVLSAIWAKSRASWSGKSMGQ